MEEIVSFPVFWCLVRPVVVTLGDFVVEKFELLEVQSDVLVVPAEMEFQLWGHDDAIGMVSYIVLVTWFQFR